MARRAYPFWVLCSAAAPPNPRLGSLQSAESRCGVLPSSSRTPGMTQPLGVDG